MAKQKSRFPSYGLVRGPSHEGGGVAGMVAGEQPVELEGGEWIIPKEAVPDYLPVLKQITNQGRAMQQMQNGNSAMDALIASASMEVGISQPKSPMYKSGGHVCHKCGKYQEGGQVCASGECAVPEMQNQMGMFSMPYQGKKIDIDLLSAMEGIKSPEYLAMDETGEPFMMQSSEIPADSLNAWWGQMQGEPIPKQEQGGPVNYYQDGGEVSWDDFTAPEEYNTHLVQSKVYDKMSQRNGKTNDYADSLIKSIALSEAGDPKQYTMDRMMEQSTSGNGAKQFGVIEDSEFKDFESGLQMGSELTATPRFKVEKEYAKEGDLEKRTGSSREQVSLGGLPGLSYLANLASKSGVSPESLVGKFFNAPLPLTLEKDIPSGKKSYKLGYSPQYQEQGGMINKYGHGGQMQPRKQQEIRNPQTYGPPLELMGPDTTGEGFQQMLNQMRMRDVNQSINPFTGDSLDIEGDSLKLLQRMQKSKMPRAGRKNMQEGGQVEGDSAGQVIHRDPNYWLDVSDPRQQAITIGIPKTNRDDLGEDNSLMSNISNDKRVKAADQYIIKDGNMTVRIPKLSPAYMQSFGMETPLSKKQNDLLRHRALSPETIGINPQVQSLLEKALMQRLTNEPI